ncbi:MAG: glutamine--fructose-6-phosphate transaminase (isomerizing) [Nanoarchaeota archaeon]
MCGIIGYIGLEETKPFLIEGLKNMEYRGYDSSGLCIKNENGLSILKREGYVNKLSESQEFTQLNGLSGIAHTRWATHGEPNEVNAHPHFDCKGEIAVVHNGIIENYVLLKENLKKEGHIFSSETDSEVIVHLIEKFYSGNLMEAVTQTLNLLEGSFAILVINKKGDKIISAKRGSPLLIGVGKSGMLVASDLSALIKHTNKIIYLKEDEIAEIGKSSYMVKNLDGLNVETEIKEVDLKPQDIEKGGYKHFMIKEINEQPQVIRNVLENMLNKEIFKFSIDLDTSSIKRIIIIGCGTSWHSGLIGKYLIEKITGIPVEVDYASEFRYRNPVVDKNDLVILLSQSGETADTLAALREAKSKGAKTLGIVNVAGSSIAREVDSVIYSHAGPEISVASTKAFTSQILTLMLLSIYLNKHNMKDNLKLIEEIEKIPGYIEKILSNVEPIKRAAEILRNSKNVFYLGRGINYPIALEGALKLKEISYIHAEGYPAAEVKHGPIALVGENFPVIFFAPKTKTYEKILSNMQEIKARKGKIIAVVNEDDDNLNTFADAVIKIPYSSEEISVILNAVVLQLFAYFIADSKGIDVDRPRNLAKSVTVE